MGTRYERRSIAPDNLSLYSQMMLSLRPGLGAQYAAWNARRVAGFAKRPITLAVPVYSMGNLTFGGTGKTPLTISLATWLVEQGRKPGIVTSGHGGSKRAEGTLVSDGTQVLESAASAGDEAILLGKALQSLGIPIAAGTKREAMARRLIERRGIDCLILDDGFQYRSLHRDADLCLIDATNPFGAGAVEEYGFLREPPDALKRATAILMTKTNLVPLMEMPKHGRALHLDWIRDALATHAPDVPVIEVPVVDPQLEDVWKDRQESKRLLPISALGNPEAFEATCRMVGIEFTDPVRYDDHTLFTTGDLQWWDTLVERGGYGGIVVSSKDWVKIHPRVTYLNAPVTVLTMRLDVPDWGAIVPTVQ